MIPARFDRSTPHAEPVRVRKQRAAPPDPVMPDGVAVARVDDVPLGTIYEAELDGESLLIVNAGGELFACDALCTHLDGPLSQGTLEGPVLRCPWHGSAFDLRTGEAINRPARDPLTCYAVTIAAGEIRIARG